MKNGILGDGFIEKSVLVDLTVQVGLDAEEFKTLFDYFLKRELIESDSRKKEYSDDAEAFRITVLGGLLSEKLTKRFEYLEMVLSDTRIQDENLTQKLLETYKEGKRIAIRDRLRAVHAWIQYLQREEEIELSGRRGCQVFALSPIGPSLENTFQKEQQRVLASLARQERQKK